MKRLAALAALAAIAIPAAAVAGDGAKVRVAPHHGGPGKVFIVGFTAPAASGGQGVVSRSYSVTADRHARTGCAWSAHAEPTASSANERVRVRLKPDGRWCRGRFSGRVTMNEGPNCEAGPPCPARAARPCPVNAQSSTGCGCCPRSEIKCPDAGNCQPAFPTRTVELGRFSFRVR